MFFFLWDIERKNGIGERPRSGPMSCTSRLKVCRDVENQRLLMRCMARGQLGL